MAITRSNNFHRVLATMAAATLLCLLSCGPAIMQPTQRLSAPNADTAVVTFFRPSSHAGGVKIILWDGEKLIGALNSKSYVQYSTAPGERVFLAQAENRSYMKANLEGGKQYYVLLKVGMGHVGFDVLKPGDPVDPNEIEKWLQELTAEAVIPDKAAQYESEEREEAREDLAEINDPDVEFETLAPGDNR